MRPIPLRLTAALLAALTSLATVAQTTDTLDYAVPTPALQEQERSYEQEYADMDRAARQARREQRRAEIGRGLRFELAPTVGLATNNRLSHRGDAYHHHTFDGGVTALLHWPLNHRWDVSAGAGVRIARRSFSNSIHFDTTSLLLTGYSLDGWHDYRCWLTDRSIVVPLRINVVTNNDLDIYFGTTIAYSMSNTFNYERMADNGKWQPVETEVLNNIDPLGTWSVELAVGMTFPLWWIFRWGWEIYYRVTPTFDTSIAGTPRINEFGLRLAL